MENMRFIVAAILLTHYIQRSEIEKSYFDYFVIQLVNDCCKNMSTIAAKICQRLLQNMSTWWETVSRGGLSAVDAAMLAHITLSWSPDYLIVPAGLRTKPCQSRVISLCAHSYNIIPSTIHGFLWHKISLKTYCRPRSNCTITLACCAAKLLVLLSIVAGAQIQILWPYYSLQQERYHGSFFLSYLENKLIFPFSHLMTKLWKWNMAHMLV